jgi:hypothetical protein
MISPRCLRHPCIGPAEQPDQDARIRPLALHVRFALILCSAARPVLFTFEAQRFPVNPCVGGLLVTIPLFEAAGDNLAGSWLLPGAGGMSRGADMPLAALLDLPKVRTLPPRS